MSGYVLITPAHNEGQHLERTIRAVQEQSLKPLRWVIVNDASTDDTGLIAEKYALHSPFVQAVTISRDGRHTFSSKANAFNAGVERVRDIDYEFIGNLDADITVDKTYYSSVIRAFNSDERVGIAGGSVFTKIGKKFVTSDQTLDSVAGAVQLFRRPCFEDIGGRYLALPYGGIDAAAEIMARMKGWRVLKLRENTVLEHRRTGTASGRPLTAQYRLGRRFYSLGYGTFFFCCRCLYRIQDYPFLVGSLAAMLGFLVAHARKDSVVLPQEVCAYLRAEQRRKLRRAISLS